MAGILKSLLKGKSKFVERSACRRALSTYELLEAILLYLEPYDVRNARLVSKDWDTVILRSRDLDARWRTPLSPLRKKIREGRILLFGKGGSGKQSLLDRWTQNVWNPSFDPTLEDNYRTLILIDRVPWIFECDTVHLEHEHLAFLKASIRDSDCYALIYSSSSRATFDSIQEWQQHTLSLQEGSSSDARSKANPAVLVALIATKCDLQDHEQEVSNGEGRQLARQLRCAFYETSAKTAYGTDQAFDGLTRSCKNVVDDPPTGWRPVPAVLPQRKPSDAQKMKIQRNECNDLAKTKIRQKVFQRFKSMRGKRISQSITHSRKDEAITPSHSDLMNHGDLSLSSLQTELLRISQT